MKLWLLETYEPPGYEEFDAKIIRAPSEQRAREIANEHTGDEGRIWDDEKLVKCDECINNGDEGTVLESFNAG